MEEVLAENTGSPEETRREFISGLFKEKAGTSSVQEYAIIKNVFGLSGDVFLSPSHPVGQSVMDVTFISA